MIPSFFKQRRVVEKYGNIILEILIFLANELRIKDLEEIPEQVKKDLKITYVKDVEDVIKLALNN